MKKGVKPKKSQLSQAVLYCFSISHFVSPGAKVFLSVVSNICLEENWPTFVYLASDKLWRDPSELGGGGRELSIFFWPTLKTRYKRTI